MPLRTSSRSSFRSQKSAYLYILPALIVVCGIVYLGIGYNAAVSTLDWNGISEDRDFVGPGNFLQILADPIVRKALVNVLIFGVLTIIVEMVVGLAMALVLTGPVVGKVVYKVIIFVPVILAPAAIAASFRQILSPNGAFNELLRGIGLGELARSWVADPTFALYAIIAVTIWQWTGFTFILYQSAITQIDHHVLEAAQIEGAGPMRIIWSVIIPQLKGTTATIVLLGVIGSLKQFDIVYLLTGGGPARSSEFLTTYIYQKVITQFEAGYAAALAIVLLILALILSALQMRSYHAGKE